MKKLILTLALVFVLVFSFVACNSEGDGGALQQGEFSLTLATNIEAAGVASGGGYYDYNDDVCIEVTVNSGYYFLGWYHNTDLISTSPVYNCKMWDQSITLEAKFTAIPEDQIGSGSAGPGMGDINREYTLTVQSNTPKLGLVNVDDVGLTEKHTALSTSGKNIKALALTISSKRFLGWFDSAGNLVMANAVFNLVMPNFDYALTAMWQCDELPNAQNTSEVYLKNAATCETRAEYYYSCSICGEKGTDTFFVGEKLPHTYDQKNTDSTYVKQYACTGSSEYYYSCVCGAKGTEVFFVTAGHSWNSENTCSVCGEYKDSSLKFVKNGDNTYGVSGYTGNGTHVVIPSTYKGLKVTSIGSNAFYGCSNLTSVTIPNSVTSIGSSAFSGCSSLTSVTLGSGVTSIGDDAFEYCYKLVEVINKSSLSITKGSEDNGYVAYYAKQVHSGESKIVKQNGYLFYTDNGVNYLIGYAGADTALTLPASYNGQSYEIYKFAFYNRSNLTSVTIGNGVTSIGDYAFRNCSNLTSVTIGSGVKSIGSSAFRNCSNLTSITLPFVGATKNGTSNKHFGYIFGASEYSYNKSYVPASLKTVVITGGSSIGSNAFYGCYNLTSVTIPNSVTSIGDDAFYGCSNLTSVTIGSGVTSIGSNAFYGCYKLVEVINKSSLYIIAGYYDYGYVAYYAKQAHKGESKIVNQNDYLFYTYNGVNYLIGYVGTDTALTLPASHNGQSYEIYQYAFYNCSDLTSIVIPDSVISIGEDAFRNCSSLTSVTIGSGVESIGRNAFYGCSSLTSIVFEDTTTWYRALYYEDFIDKTGGTETSVTNASTNATNFKSTYESYYWYKK